MFYPDKRDHVSPYSVKLFNSSRKQFAERYFEEEEGFESKAMEAGTKIHKLVEAGVIKAKEHYSINEEKIEIELENGVKVLGIPDSMTRDKDIPKFVDYKSGKANGWEDKIHGDLKFAVTAWLVWQKEGKPAEVKAAIEFIPTTYNSETEEIEPLDEETEVIETSFSAEYLEKITDRIKNTIKEVNEYYEKYDNRTEEFIEQTKVQKYEELRKKKEEIEEEMDELKGEILNQMEIGGVENYNGENGLFYTSERSYYDYPESLKFKHEDKEMTKKEFEELKSNYKKAKKNLKRAKKDYKLVTEPKKVVKLLRYRKN